jgi:hypothetical protein
VTEAPAQSFAALSAALTGFRVAELWGTGQVEPYLAAVLATVGDDVVARLLREGDEALGSPDPRQALQERVLDDDRLGPVARNVIVLWYLGQWDPLPQDWRNRFGASPLDVAGVVSPAAYRSGLVWRAIGAHPMGAEGPGYGSWATAPTLPAAG